MDDVETCFSIVCSKWARFWNCLRVCFKQVKAFKNGLLGDVYKEKKKNRGKFLTTWKSRTNHRTLKRYEEKLRQVRQVCRCFFFSLCKIYRFHVTLGLFTSLINHRRRQNLVKTSVTHSHAAQCRIFVFTTFWRHLELLNRRTTHCNMESIR